MSGTPPIAVENLNHWFGAGPLRRQVLCDITTTIPRGEIVIVTGPSGSGKTTMLTIVGALRSAQAGSVRVLGQELRGAKSGVLELVRKHIGFIFQQHNLLGALTATQNVELGLRVTGKFSRGELRRRAVAMLEAVGLGEHAEKKPDQMSGGQRQRVAIARALVGEPAMLLADEPTASLDRASGREIVDRMQALAKEHGTTILLVTHDNRILDVADRILHLEDGRLSTFTDAVIASTQQLMHTLAENKNRQNLEDVVAGMDEPSFRRMLEDLTQESQRFLQAINLAEDQAYRSMLEQSLRVFTRRVGDLLNAERASLFLVDRPRQELILQVSQDAIRPGSIRIPLASGIAGAAATSGRTVRVADAYADPRFNPEVDRTTNFRTRSVLCLPLHDTGGNVFAVTQLLNRRDGQPFDENDERRFAEFAGSLGILLESLVGMVAGAGSR
ncbi:MAG: ATP-binding cassette domain-containing protein [Gammaproteobacteria bacterium]|nr:ATP-binding cassette domain-containing protein [Gammaproteobacteria bacterium]